MWEPHPYDFYLGFHSKYECVNCPHPGYLHPQPCSRYIRLRVSINSSSHPIIITMGVWGPVHFLCGGHTLFCRFARITNPCPNPRQPWKSRSPGGGGGGRYCNWKMSRWEPEARCSSMAIAPFWSATRTSSLARSALLKAVRLFFYPSIGVGVHACDPTSYIGPKYFDKKQENKGLARIFCHQFGPNITRILPELDTLANFCPPPPPPPRTSHSPMIITSRHIYGRLRIRKYNATIMNLIFHRIIIPSCSPRQIVFAWLASRIRAVCMSDHASAQYENSKGISTINISVCSWRWKGRPKRCSYLNSWSRSSEIDQYRDLLIPSQPPPRPICSYYCPPSNIISNTAFFYKHILLDKNNYPTRTTHSTL